MFILEIIKAIILGIVEGITEWLPISSTGHMILFDEFLHLKVSPMFLELFLVVIQLGAILAVPILFFDKLYPLSKKKSKEENLAIWNVWGKVIVGAIPAAILGNGHATTAVSGKNISAVHPLTPSHITRYETVFPFCPCAKYNRSPPDGGD